MTRLIPIVVLLDEERLPDLHEATDHYRKHCPIDMYERMTVLKVPNGWTDDAIVAGVLLGDALFERREPTVTS